MTNKVNILFHGLLYLVMAILFTGCAAIGKNTDDEYRDAELMKNIQQKLDAALPRWEEKLLKAPTPVDWSRKLSVHDIVDAVDDEAIKISNEAPPHKTKFFSDENRAIRFYPERGEVRFINRKRAWNAGVHQDKSPPGKNFATRKTFTLVKKLGMPETELNEPKVDTQMVSIGSKTYAERINMPVYNLVTSQRIINGIPVQGSRLRYSLNPSGEIERLKVSWPAFVMGDQLQLAQRDTVIKRATEMILRYQPSAEVTISGRLAYVKADGDEDYYMPAMLVDVSDGKTPTPYRVVVPVVQ